jgi:hypothetical protein
MLPFRLRLPELRFPRPLRRLRGGPLLPDSGAFPVPMASIGINAPVLSRTFGTGARIEVDGHGSASMSSGIISMFWS